MAGISIVFKFTKFKEPQSVFPDPKKAHYLQNWSLADDVRRAHYILRIVRRLGFHSIPRMADIIILVVLAIPAPRLPNEDDPCGIDYVMMCLDHRDVTEKESVGIKTQELLTDH
jgi:hypothetical protein